jgi:hypothetical protein
MYPEGREGSMAHLTRLTNFKKLANEGELGVILGRLMLAVNDLSIANDALGQWMSEQTGIRKTRAKGAKMYFVRILISHVFEALKIINRIKSTPELMRIIERAPKVIQDHFSACLRVIGTDDYKLMKAMRNDVSFHYLDQTVRDAIASQAEKAPEVPLELQVGDDTLHWYSEPGDRIIDSAVVRGVCKIPEGADIQPTVDNLIHRMQSVGDHLAHFGGYFIMEYGT